MAELTAGKIRRSLRRFVDFASDLSNSDMNTFGDRLSFLMDYCKNDQVFSIIHNQLLNVADVDFDSWYTSLQSTRGGRGELTFPTDLDERMSLMYRLLDKVNQGEINLIGFAQKFFVVGDSSYDSRIHAFNDAIVEPLARELSYRIEDLDEEMPEDDKEMYPLANIQIVHSATNVIQQSASGQDIQQDACLKADGKLGKLFDELRQELKKTVKDTEELKKALQKVECSEELAKKGASSLPSVEILLKSLGVLGKVASIVSAIVAILN